MGKAKRALSESKTKYAGSVVVTRIATIYEIEKTSLLQLEEIAKTLDSQNPVKPSLAGFKGEQLSLFDTDTLTHSESEV